MGNAERFPARRPREAGFLWKGGYNSLSMGIPRPSRGRSLGGAGDPGESDCCGYNMVFIVFYQQDGLFAHAQLGSGSVKKKVAPFPGSASAHTAPS